MRQIIQKFITKPLYLVIGAIIIVGGAYYYFSGNNTEVSTLTITFEDFKQTVSVSGTVVAAEHVDLGFAESGRVSHIYAAVGDVVTKGTILATVENADLAAAIVQKEANLQTEKSKLLSLKNGTRPETLSINATTVAKDENALRDAIRSAYVSADDAVRKKVDQFFSNARTPNAVLTFSISDSMLENRVKQERIELESVLVAWRAEINVPIFATTDPVSAAKIATQHLTQVATLLADASQALSLSSSASALYQTDVNTARTTIASSLISLTTATGALDASRGALILAKAGTTLEDIAAQESTVKAAEALVTNARATLAKTIVTAPFLGIVTKMDVKPGENVSVNASKIALISNGAFEIETYVPQISVSKVAQGNKAVVTLDAYGVAATFTAEIISVDPAETVRDGVSTYKTMLLFADPDSRIRSGMSANVLVTIGEKPSAIIIPSGAIQNEGSRSFVTMAGDRSKREISVGDTPTLGRVEVISGLSSGDVILLTP